MEPLTAIGLVANIAQIISLGTILYKTTKEIKNSQRGMADATKHSHMLANVAQDLSFQLGNFEGRELNENEKALQLLAQECYDLSQDIIGITESLRANSKFLSSLAVWLLAFRTLKRNEEKQVLEKRLRACSVQLGLQLTYISR